MNSIHLDLDDDLRQLFSPLKKFVNNEVECITCKSQTDLSVQAIKKFPNLKLIVARCVGVDNIDLSYCKTHGIAVYHIADYGSEIVAEHALALTLCGTRHISAADREVHAGKFSYKSFLGSSISGKTIGVVGTGKIGLAFIQLLSSFNVTILAYDVIKIAKVRYVSLKELLTKSDIVSLHVPLLPTTKHKIGDKELKMMKTGSILVNTARGAIIDEKALIKNIQKFSAVCLDVVENEDKFTKDNPLLKYDNVIITPHIGFYTKETIQRIATQTKRCIQNYIHENKKGRVV